MDYQIFELAIRFHREPDRFPHLTDPAQPLPDDVTALLGVGVDEAHVAPENLPPVWNESSPEERHAATVFFVRNALLAAGGNYYRYLGLNRDASGNDIRQHFQLLTKLLSSGTENEQPLWDETSAVRINEAYSVLRQPEKRHAYDPDKPFESERLRYTATPNGNGNGRDAPERNPVPERNGAAEKNAAGAVRTGREQGDFLAKHLVGQSRIAGKPRSIRAVAGKKEADGVAAASSGDQGSRGAPGSGQHAGDSGENSIDKPFQQFLNTHFDRLETALSEEELRRAGYDRPPAPQGSSRERAETEGGQKDALEVILPNLSHQRPRFNTEVAAGNKARTGTLTIVIVALGVLLGIVLYARYLEPPEQGQPDIALLSPEQQASSAARDKGNTTGSAGWASDELGFLGKPIFERPVDPTVADASPEAGAAQIKTPSSPPAAESAAPGGTSSGDVAAVPPVTATPPRKTETSPSTAIRDNSAASRDSGGDGGADTTQDIPVTPSPERRAPVAAVAPSRPADQAATDTRRLPGPENRVTRRLDGDPAEPPSAAASEPGAGVATPSRSPISGGETPDRMAGTATGAQDATETTDEGGGGLPESLSDPATAAGESPVDSGVPAAIVSGISADRRAGRGASPDEPVPITLKELDRLLEQFVTLYRDGNVNAFLNLFSTDVRTNGRNDRNSIRDDYKDLFNGTDVREFRLSDMKWEPSGNAVAGRGTFDVKIRYRGDRNEKNLSGIITFLVERRPEGVVFTQMFHSYDK